MIGPLNAAPAPSSSPTELRNAAVAFEALFLQQMLKSALPDQQGGGSIGLQALATQLAQGSPFGIAWMLEGQAGGEAPTEHGSMRSPPAPANERPAKP